MPETSIEALTGQFPSLSGQFTTLSEHLEGGYSVYTEIQGTKELLDSQRDSLSEIDTEVREADNGLKNSIVDDDSLLQLEKVALLTALRGLGLEYLGRVDYQSFPDQRFRATPQQKLDKLKTEFTSIASSLRGIERATRVPGNPLLYFQAQGGTSYRSISGLRELPEASKFFTAETTGTGVEFRASGSWPICAVSFDIQHPEPLRIPNFVSGHQNGNRVEVTRPEEVAGTAGRADVILKRSLSEMQTNAIFVGENARRKAINFLAQRVAVVTCEIPGALIPIEAQV